MSTTSQQNAGKRHQIAAEHSKTEPHSRRTQQNNTKSRQTTAKLHYIIVAESRNILRIPLHTVTGSLVLPTVTLLDDGSEIPEHPITTGNSDDYWIEIIDGLSEGDQIIGTYLESSSATDNENLKVVANSISQRYE